MNTDPFDIPLQGRQLVEASAGTGKTYTITSLYVRLALGLGLPEPLPVQKILVLTFTNAATGELRGRISERLRQARDALQTGSSDDAFLQRLIKETSDDPTKYRKLLTAALQLMDEAAVMTIHSFCARVLSEEPFESGTLFEQQPAEDGDAFALAACQDVFRSQLLTLAPLERQLALSIWKDPNQLQSKMAQLLKRQAVDLIPPREKVSLDEDQLRSKIQAAKQGWLEHDLVTVIKDANLSGRSKPVTRLDAMSAFCAMTDPGFNSDLWGIYGADSLAAAHKKASTQPEHEVLNLIEEIHQRQRDFPQIKTNLWHQFLQALRDRVEELKAKQNAMTLDDLLTRLRDALAAEGSTLAPRLSSRWPVLMVDEFQDTDDIQTAIFDPIAAVAQHQALLMVGDPKQAIYQFRGADIYTYLNAREQTQARHSLSVNWRSTAAMVQATNSLFVGRHRFDVEGDIGFPESSAAPEPKAPLLIDGATPKPYQLLLTDLHNDEPPTYSASRIPVMAAIAGKTAELLNGAATGKVTLDGKPLAASSIAFLVRTRADAEKARFALAERGVQSVYLTLDSVLLESAAADMQLILQAVIDPTNSQALKAALATRLMQSDADEIDRIDRDLATQQAALEEFQRYHDLWQKENVGPMLSELIVRRQLAQKWLRLEDGERQLTNLRHLLELLQARATAAPGMHRLLKWFVRECDGAPTAPANDERQLRLESDENLVKIVTMHAAKGLEYDLVMLPFPYFSATARKSEPLLFHDKDEDQHYHLKADISAEQEYKLRAESEFYAENMRLLYVALTRARYLCYMGVPNVKQWGSLAKTAMGELLHLQDWEPEGTGLAERLAAKLPEEGFEIIDCQASGSETFMAAASQDSRRAPPPLPAIADAWRLHSYTSVAARLRSGAQQVALHQAAAVVERAGYSDDDTGVASGAALGELSRFSFPRGASVGIALHKLMETADYGEDALHDNSRQEACRRALEATGLGTQQGWQPVMSDWLDDILATPLNDEFCLSLLPRADRVDEMEFHFPLACASDTFGFLQSEGFLQHRNPNVGKLAGMMTGKIDLVFRQDGKYYLADYKSNHLGDDFGDYAQPRLQEAMQEHLYDLQYLIYTVALTRHLAQRLPDYSYDAHFGGIYYLFLRGMEGASGGGTGIFFDRPDASVISALDEKMKG